MSDQPTSRPSESPNEQKAARLIADAIKNKTFGDMSFLIREDGRFDKDLDTIIGARLVEEYGDNPEIDSALYHKLSDELFAAGRRHLAAAFEKGPVRRDMPTKSVEMPKMPTPAKTASEAVTDDTRKKGGGIFARLIPGFLKGNKPKE